MQHIPFIGNAINRMSGAASWTDVLRGLAEFVGKGDIIMRYIDEKPFTLVFEEVFLRAARARDINELDLKKQAASLVAAIPSAEPHSRLMNLGTPHILTTNYDYNLENGSKARHRDASLRKEQRYSLFRRHMVASQSVWHIHGEVLAPASLALGHDHYSGSLHHVRDYLVTRSKRALIKESPFIRGETHFDTSGFPYSWLDLFLRDHIHIFGFSMDYTEMELWWLLAFKERLRLKGRPVGQTIFYVGDAERPTKREQGRWAILESYRVEVVHLRADTHLDAFDRFIRAFKKRSA